METVGVFLKELELELPCDPTTPLLGLKSVYQKDICNPIFTAALFLISKIWNQPEYPTMDD